MENTLENLLRGSNQLAKRICSIISANEKSTIVSPISIHSALTLLSQDPWFFNKESFNRLLNVDDVNNTSECYKRILALLNAIDGRHFLLANKLFFKDQRVIQERFRNRLLNDYLYEIDSLNLNETETAAQLMNNWVGDKTSHKTQNLANPGNVSDKSRLTLLNTMYFADKWAKPFSQTAPGEFHINETDTIGVEMMKIRSEFYYKEDEYMDCKVLQLPFVDNDDISLIVVLPNVEETYGSFDLSNCNNISVTENMSLEEVEVSIPIFKMEETFALDDLISKMELETAFSAIYTGMIDDEELNLKKLQQKVIIDVNQAGTEAASGLISTLDKAEEEKVLPKNGLTIYEMNIKTDITNRFAKTKVVWKTKNVEESAKNATFKVVLSETAFITGFIMEIEGKSYKSYIKEKEEAKAIYDEAVARGQSAGLVEAKTRDSKEFSVSVNLEPGSVAVFNLTYEEMLQRIHDQYELVVNICPGQIIDYLNVEVDIMETRPLKFVKTPPLRSGNEIVGPEYEKYLEPSSNIQIVNAKTASIKFRPDPKKQRLMAHYLGGKQIDGLSGQFVVQYDVERDPKDGQVLLQDGYFVHFFAPNDLDPLPKHVVFVLDTSGSMGGRKIEQLKDAMLSILKDIRKNDIISIIEFSSEVNFWDINSEECTVLPVFNDTEDFQDPFIKLGKMSLPVPSSATEETLIKARNVVQKMEAFGGTYMIGGLNTALYLIKIAQDKVENKSGKHQPIIVFLTDGEPNVGMSSTEQIVDTVTRLNLRYNKVPIFSLSFGRGADKNFLRKLSLKNQGFSRHIYEAADASLQLQEFYKQISSPLLADIQFKYDSEVADVTRTRFPIYFRGSEIVVIGRYKGPSFPTTVNCWGPRGPIIIASIIERPVTSLERLWAYLTVKQLLDERETVDDKTELTKKATALALKYSFVTDVTSLVVVKPNETSALSNNHVEANEALKGYMGQAMCALSSRTGTARQCMKRMFGGGGSGYLERECMGTSEKRFSTKKKELKEFAADRPFYIFLQFKKENRVVVLFQGCVYKPTF